MMFNNQKPTVQMLGRWQPWHNGHTELFKRAVSITGQVAIMVRDVEGIIGDAGDGRTKAQVDNPFKFDEIVRNISHGLQEHGYALGDEYIIIPVPNIVDISYGRGVGYTFTEHDLGADVHEISATKIRAEMRDSGELAPIDSVAVLGGGNE